MIIELTNDTGYFGVTCNEQTFDIELPNSTKYDFIRVIFANMEGTVLINYEIENPTHIKQKIRIPVAWTSYAHQTTLNVFGFRYGASATYQATFSHSLREVLKIN